MSKTNQTPDQGQTPPAIGPNASLEQQLAAKDAEIGTLKGAYERQLFDKDTVIATLTKERDAKALEAKQAEELIAELQKELSKEESGSGSETIVSHKGKKYRVAVPAFKIKDQEYTAEDLKTNKELLAKLVEKTSSVLQPLN